VKARKLVFAPKYPELVPPEGMSAAWFLKRLLIEVTGLEAARMAAETRALWRLYSELEAEPDRAEFTLSVQDWEVLKRRWEACFPQAAGIGYKWLSSLDEILHTAQEIDLK